jgi:hypothetical protein
MHVLTWVLVLALSAIPATAATSCVMSIAGERTHPNSAEMTSSAASPAALPRASPKAAPIAVITHPSIRTSVLISPGVAPPAAISSSSGRRATTALDSRLKRPIELMKTQSAPSDRSRPRKRPATERA